MCVGSKARKIDLDNRILRHVVPEYELDRALKALPGDRQALLEAVLPITPQEYITTVSTER